MDVSIATAGIILKKTPYGERGFILSLLTQKLGLVRVFLRGGRQEKHHKSTAFNRISLELFSQSEWFLKRGRLYYFPQAAELYQAYVLEGREIWSGYYLNELLLRLLPDSQEDNSLYLAYHYALKSLTEKKTIEPPLRYFERRLLMHLGILPDFLFDQNGLPIQKDRYYRLSPSHGFILAAKDKGDYNSDNAPLFSGEFLQKIAETEAFYALSPQEDRAYKKMMRSLYAPLLGERPLQSRLWLKQLYND